MTDVVCTPIGVIHTPHKKQADTPIQGVFSPDSRGEVEVFPPFVDGLKDIAGFSHLILLYHFHLCSDYALQTKPFLANENMGIFAIRHFKRPNHIGLSIVRLYAVRQNTLEIGEVDMVDGTPLLDIKPYVPEFDYRESVKDGWYQRAENKPVYEQHKGVPQRLEDFQ